jgi:SHS2 domain-containing protein
MERTYIPSNEGVTLGDHTADIWLGVEASSLDECIHRALHGLYSVMSQEFILHSETGSSEVYETEESEMLLVDILSEALFLFDSESSLILHPEISMGEGDESDKTVLKFVKAACSIPPEKGGMEVKAVTFHGAELKQVDSGWKGRVLLDL